MQLKPSIDDLKAYLPDVEIGEVLGEGGYKIVYRCRINGIAEALKIVHVPKDPNDETVEDENVHRLMREINLLGACTSPFLVKLGSMAPTTFSIGGEDFVIYSEEVLEGLSLRQHITAGHRPDMKELVSVARCGFAAVADLWQQNVVHRDIKPDNVMALSDKARPYVLLDLGVAFVVGGTPLTRDPRSVHGTLYYLAPEMLDANFRENLDLRADLYAVGLTVYEYACGLNPFMRRSDAEFTTLQRIYRDTPPPLQQLRPDLSVGFCKMIDQLLKKRPALRPNLRSLMRRMEEFQ